MQMNQVGEVKLKYLLPLLIFPLLELATLIVAYWSIRFSLFATILLLLLSSLCLSYSLHVFFHECVHRFTQCPQWFNVIASLLMGLPFDGYRIHHYNHHHYENALGDFSSTWASKNKPFILVSYVLGWPRQLLPSISSSNPFGDTHSSSFMAEQIRQRIGIQKIAIFALLTLSAVFNWQLCLLYVLLVYVGWAFIALQNYGQHPPIAGKPTCTYARQWYNRLFFNNGLHWEHHNQPACPWQDLKLNENSIRINHAHPINPLIAGDHI